MGAGTLEAGIRNGRQNGLETDELELDHVHELAVLVEERLVVQFLRNDAQNADKSLVGAQPALGLRLLQP